jgi:hypothetical protein
MNHPIVGMRGLLAKAGGFQESDQVQFVDSAQSTQFDDIDSSLATLDFRNERCVGAQLLVDLCLG